MKLRGIGSKTLFLVLLLGSLTIAGCTDDFYLSEKEAAAYAHQLLTAGSANATFDNLQGRSVNLQFDNSTGTPRLQSSNLLVEMRRTELAQLETGPAAVSLDRLREELEKQIGNWINEKLQLYTGDNNEQARLTTLDNVSVRFMSNPVIDYNRDSQSINFDIRFTITMNCTIHVNAVNWLVNLFANINGTYPLQIVVNELHLNGEASVISPYANAGRIKFKLVPHVLGSIDANEISGHVPDEVKTGIRELLAQELSVQVNEVFDQDYSYFALAKIEILDSVMQSPKRLSVTYRPKTPWYRLPAESTNPMLHLVTRAADGKLYHARKSSGGWSEYAAVPMPAPSPTPFPRIDNDPTLVHSGADQLELAATNAAGDLVYAHWRDETWGNWRIFRPNNTYSPPMSYRGKPAVAASAPGQAEIIAEGSNGQLWHLRRMNGVWLTPVAVRQLAAPLMTLPLRDPMATIAGNKLTILYVDAQNRLFGQIFDLEINLWGQPAQIQTQETIRYAPAVVVSAVGPIDNVDIVYVGQSGAAYHRRLAVQAINLTPPPAAVSGFSVGPEAMIGGSLNATPILVASGYKQVELIGRFTDYRLRHNHFVYALAPYTEDGRSVNPGWQGWQPMTDNLFGTAITTDGRMSEFAAAATPTGRVELAARGYANVGTLTQNIFHNNYESGRYGRAPWKTVQWRGYDVAGAQLFAGRPALAAVDQNFEIAFEGNWPGGSGVWFDFARLSASNLTNVMIAYSVRAMQTPIDPVVLSSGFGITDNIYLGADGRLHHERQYSDGSARPYTLPGLSGLLVSRQLAADSYGNGLIELAALATDGRIYHWRFRDGAWSAPVVVASNIASSPVLMHTGDGQLELSAIDIDHKLYRWYFNGTSWSGRLSVPSSFRINEALYKPMSASSWGDGSIDVAVVNLDTKALYHRRIGPGDETCTLPIGCPAPRVFTNLGGTVLEAPAITAFSPSRLNILTMQSLRIFSIWASLAPFQPITVPPQRDPTLRWSGFEDTGGSEMVVGAAANAGRRNYAAVAIDFSGRILINRNSDGRWTGFQPLIGQTPDMILQSPLVLPTLAAHGSQ